MLQIQLNGQVFTVSGLVNVSVGPPTPPAPTALIVNDNSSQPDVLLQWTNAAAYDQVEIWKADDLAPATLLATIPLNTQYHDLSFPNTAGKYREYTVRGVTAGTPSNFSNAAGAALTLGTLGLPIYIYPNLQVHFGSFISTTTTTVTAVTFPTLRVSGGIQINEPLVSLNLNSLTRIGGSVFSLSSTQLTTISLPAFTTIAAGVGVSFDTHPLLTDLLLPVLTGVDADFSISACEALLNVSAPALSTISGSLNVAHLFRAWIFRASLTSGLPFKSPAPRCSSSLTFHP